MSDDADGPKTPKSSGSYLPFLSASVDLRDKLEASAMAYTKRLELGHDYTRARACRLLALDAELLVEGFDSWTREPPSDEARGRDIDALFSLIERAKPLLSGAGFDW